MLCKSIQRFYRYNNDKSVALIFYLLDTVGRFLTLSLIYQKKKMIIKEFLLQYCLYTVGRYYPTPLVPLSAVVFRYSSVGVALDAVEAFLCSQIKILFSFILSFLSSPISSSSSTLSCHPTNLTSPHSNLPYKEVLIARNFALFDILFPLSDFSFFQTSFSSAFFPWIVLPSLRRTLLELLLLISPFK